MIGLGNSIQFSSSYQFEPTDVSSLALWLKNGAGVATNQWDDSSGNDNHAIQNTEGNRAATDGGGLDFERDNSQFYNLTSKIDIADNGGFCVAVVVTRESEVAGCLLSDGSNELFQFQNATTLRIKTLNSSATVTTTDVVLPAGTFATGSKLILLTNRSAGANNKFSFFKNGSALTADTDTSSNEAAGENPGGIEFSILGSRTGGSNYFDGIIHEVLVWNKGLDATEIAEVNSYLKEIHGL